MPKSRPPRAMHISITIRCVALQKQLPDVSQLHLRATQQPQFDHYDEAQSAEMLTRSVSGGARNISQVGSIFRSEKDADVTSDKRDYRMQLFDARVGALASGNSRASSS